MTDLGGGYGPQGSRPWHPGDPGYADAPDETAQPHPDSWQQQQQMQQAQQQGQYVQNPYGQQQQPQQGGWQQQNPQGFPQQQPQQQGQYVQNPYGQQPQQFVQQQNPQQFVQQQMPQQQMPPQQQAPRNPGPGMPQRPQPAAQASAPARPTGPGPDGIDWEAEAAALDSPRFEPEAEAEGWHEDEQAEEYVEEYADEEHEPEHESFFGGEEDSSREAERKRKEKGKASGRRNRGACLVVALVLMGGVAGAGYWGYGFYQSHFGPPADYVGAGAGSVSIEIKPGSSGGQMGNTLRDADVVKSVAAFVNAFNNNSKAGSIQPGSYTLHHQMSAAAAVQQLVDSNGGNALVIPEGKKATDIYTLIDNKLKLQKGATAAAAVAQVGNLGLPAYANGNLEGFLFPTRYSVTEGMKPEDMLKQMVAMAVQHYGDLKLDDGAKNIGLANGYQVIIEASILQAEGNNDKDFGKIARVLYNRLNTKATQGYLQVDTTLQYKLGRTNFTKAEKDGDKSPYNTYTSKGLPQTPISNPGDEAIQAVLNPTPGDWVYFVAVSPTDTRFSVTLDQFRGDVKEYCTAHNQGFDSVGVMCK